MGMKMSEHADKLRELGFEELPTSRRQRKQRAGDPYFTAGSAANGKAGITYATDELGQRWMAMAVVDLSSIGFRNNSPQARKIRKDPRGCGDE